MPESKKPTVVAEAENKVNNIFHLSNHNAAQ